MDDSHARSAGDLINRFIDSIHARDDDGLVPFFRSWSAIVGTDISAHSRPVDIRNGSLIVEVDHPGWAQRVQMNRARYLATIKKHHRKLEIRNIHIYVSDDFAPPTSKPEAERDEGEAAKRPPTAGYAKKAPERRLEGDLDSIPDDDLRDSLAGLARALEDREAANGDEGS